MKCWSSNNQNHNAYAGCFFSKKTSLKSISLKKYSWFFEICIKIFAYFHKYDFLRKIIKNFIVWYPFGLVLEAPSLVLSFMWINVLKTVDIWDLYVIHLSQNGYV